MLVQLYTSLFDSPAQTLVNTVNTVGVMGKGIAKIFKQKHPDMFREYKHLCDTKSLSIGQLHLWKGNTIWILNFPTKTTWKKPSKLDYISAGLDTFRSTYKDLGITSIAFPPLGCGNGELDWNDVKPLMESYLENLSIPVYMHSLHFGPEFVPEHREPTPRPQDFSAFICDLRRVLFEYKGLFHTLDGDSAFHAKIKNNMDIHIDRNGDTRIIPAEELERSWVKLRDGILSGDQFGTESSRRNKSYLFPILVSLPYIMSAPIRRTGNKSSTTALGLYFDRRADQLLEESRPDENGQGWLLQ